MPSNDANTATIGPLAALALLELPDRDRLTERQRRGIDCVFSGIPLTPATAVNLGVRDADRDGAPCTWYPRAHRTEVQGAALATMHTHVLDCDLCRKDATLDDCRTGRALVRLMREYRR